MKIYKLSMSTKFFNDEEFFSLIKDNKVSLSEYTAAKGTSNVTQFDEFVNAGYGDLFFLSRSNESIELIGMFVNKGYLEYNDDWKVKKFIPIIVAKNKHSHVKDLGRWWHPSDNSTFIEVQNLEEFESTILKPVFDITVEELRFKHFQTKKAFEIMNPITKLIESKKQIILQGPPGTGKTFTAKKVVENWENDGRPCESTLIQFHPAYTYEDFVRGIVTEVVDGKVNYVVANKVFGKLCSDAIQTPGKDFVLIIDEINRANLPAVLGELIYALEYRWPNPKEGETIDRLDEKRKEAEVNSTYALDSSNAEDCKHLNKLINKNPSTIAIPENLYIIGTMNTADRSVGHMDYAIRRRFAFVNVLPSRDVIPTNEGKALFDKVSTIFDSYTSAEFNVSDVAIGHSYFLTEEKSDTNKIKGELEIKLDFEIRPLLMEYLKDGVLKAEAKEAINNLTV